MMRELSWCGTSRTLSGSPAELNDLEFEADGKLEIALNAAFIKLQEFAYDRELSRATLAHDRALSAELRLPFTGFIKASP